MYNKAFDLHSYANPYDANLFLPNDIFPENEFDGM